jgi:hypothetical protein
MEEEDEEIETKICCWWYIVRFGRHAKSNVFFLLKKYND